jgi:hypothetical protein
MLTCVIFERLMSDPLFGVAISDLALQRALAKLESTGRLIAPSNLADVVAEAGVGPISREALLARCTEYLDAHLRRAGGTVDRGPQVGLQHSGVDNAFARTDRPQGLFAAELEKRSEPPKLIIVDGPRRREEPVIERPMAPMPEEPRKPPEVSAVRGVPKLVDGCLPEGIHVCTLQEVIAAFGVTSAKRRDLADRLRDYVSAAARSGLIQSIYLAGSFVTDKREPGDIDVLVVLKPDFDASKPLRAIDEQVIDTRAARIRFKFDVFAGVIGSEALEANLMYFTRDNRDASVLHLRKGVLRIDFDV